MCGILAAAGKNASHITQTSLDAALASLSHRGPDDHGVMQFPSCTLGQTRLSIIDLSQGGHQPMRDAEAAIAITFNGEIYNYKELRKELEQKGHHFRTESDTEVILKAYLAYGEDCPQYLDGMFAFALWDEKKQTLFMARDRFGKKPLYYAFDASGTLLVASEIKALLAAGIKGVLDPAAIDQYLTLMYIPPWKSVYKNISVLLPGHSATFKNGALATTRYWQLESHPINISYDEAKEEVRRLFTDSVRKRMIADVEIGTFLSGGVDSTLVTAYAQRFATHPIKTFSVGYGEYINELPFALQASKTIGTDHHTLQATSDLTDELERVLAYFDEPHADSSDFPQHLVSQLASTKVKVALSGDGADELFLGYGWYRSYWNTRKIVRLKNMLLSNPFKQHLKNITMLDDSLRHSLWKDGAAMQHEGIDFLVKDIPGNGIEKINSYDLSTYLPGQLLSKVDQTGMMHSLEVRCPFLDHTLAEFVYNLPIDYKSSKTEFKRILKDLLLEILPPEFVYRKKQGFGAPVRKWLESPSMRAYTEAKLSPGAHIYAYLREDTVQALLKRFYHGDPKESYQLWIILCLELWLQSHPQ